MFGEWLYKISRDILRLSGVSSPPPAEYVRLMSYQRRMDELLASEGYVARSDWQEIGKDAEETVAFFKVLSDSGMLAAFCRKNRISEERVISGLVELKTCEGRMESHNERWLSGEAKREEEYLDHILDAVDPGIRLDAAQREVVLSDEDYTLVIAGAGAGKTTTVAAKVKYLVERKNVDPRDILIISFTNKAVQELRERIQKAMGIDCPITTFHSAGNAILRIHSDEKQRVVDDGVMYNVLRNYFRHTVLQNESLTQRLILFFGSYFDAPYEGDDLNAFFRRMSRRNLTTIRSDLNEYTREILDTRSHKKITIQNEILRSMQEVEIANFLYLNGIEYEYEPIYRYNILASGKPYTPDFILTQGDHTAYLEHFGISQDGKNRRYSKEELERYKQAVNDKIRLHRQHGTELLYTFSSYRDRRPLTEHLREELQEHGFVLKPRSPAEVLEKLVAGEENRYIRKLLMLLCRFISNYKVNGYTESGFDRMIHSTDNVRSQLFLEICHDCYLEYERFLKENHCIDFQDMINESARLLREAGEMKERLHFRYIIVDEYQDISRQRFDLTKALSEVTDAKIIAVGDDWQSIYAFSGSDISLFTHFEESMGHAKLMRIENTYRNAQEVIDIAGHFIQQNPEQISKSLHSPKHIQDPVIIYTYDGTYKKPNGDRRSGAGYASAFAVQEALGQIRKYREDLAKPVKSSDAEGGMSDRVPVGAVGENADARSLADAGRGMSDRIPVSAVGENADARSLVDAGREAAAPISYGSVLLLGRYGFDGDNLARSGLFTYDRRRDRLVCLEYPDMDITFMTAHSSKGLGYDNVIVVNARNETYGFPSKIEDDPVLSFVIHGDRGIDYAEERRLFYVAMTRTKNRVYFIAPEQNPSEFLLELKKNYKNVVLRGEWNENEPEQPYQKRCPVCGYPMQLRYKKAYGLRLYLCTNEPEICDFMTNEIKAGTLSIRKCDSCRDGYLIIKPGRNGSYFLGCTNYRKDGKGCNRTVSTIGR